MADGPEDDLVEALRAENDALRLRIAELEGSLHEYRRQVNEIVTSASWRITAPLRDNAGRVRLARKRARRLPRTLLTRTPQTGQTAGLFPPDDVALDWVDSPLLALPLGAGTPSARTRTAPPARARVLVVAHVYYPEVWLDIEERLARLPEAYDLVVTLVRGKAESLETRIASRFPHARVLVVENHGRDLGPLVELANAGWFSAGHDAVLKVHTKRSVHRVDGDAWRLALLDGVLPSPQGVARVLELLRADEHVGVVCPDDSLRGAETWGSDRELVEALASRFPFAFDPDALRYPAGSMYWTRPWLLQRLADLELTTHHFAPEAGHMDGSTAHALERFTGVLAGAAGLDQVEACDVASRLSKARKRSGDDPRVLAFYLPQYHQVPENDAWWGVGFTDWVNTARATPLYDGHLQPVEPGELGRYDLSDPSVLPRQAALAREHGVDGFVVYHYWFDGRQVLDTPLRNLLADPTADVPFALCWANENWTRSWDGLDKDVLLAQTYPDGWADRYYDDVLPALRDPRYLRVDGRPVLVVYRIGQVPDARAVVQRWKQRALDDGLGGLHVLAVTPSRDFEDLDPSVASVLDGLVRFPPGSGIGLQSVRSLVPGLVEGTGGDVLSYDGAIDEADLATTGPHGLRVHPGVMPGWDNTPRRGKDAYVFHGGNPVSFRRWLSRAVDAARASGPEPLVFVNAWNEWAEGAHLEPDGRFGRGNLEAVRDVLRR